MRVLICGRLAVEAETVVVPEAAFPGRLGRRLWTYLVLNRRRPVARAEIVDALWGEESPETADASLNALVSRVRTAVAPLGDRVALHAATGTYALSLEPDAFVDRERAWLAITHVQAIRREGKVRDAWSEAIIAHEITARGFLPGEDAPWIESERRTLADVRLQALDAICDAELAEQRPAEAERVARQLIITDPLRESGYRFLMRAVTMSGNRASAAAVMEECRRALATVGANPSPETERTFREVLPAR